jgi:1-pyrroline-5-carboxylate dehydrogenase
MADVDEAIDFLRFYSRELDRNDGYQYDTGEPTPGQHCSNGLEPYGVFGVIGPFNFPCAIFTGMTAGAAITGNAVVAKPASATPLIGHKVVEILSAAGVPDGALNLVTGGGRAVGTPLVEHDDVDGIVFTGSRAVGDRIRRTFIELDKRGPVIAELGGKNPVVVTDTADLGKAVSGVANGAFGYSGQKCSATSRVYVDETVFEPFTRKLVSAAEDLPIRQPRDPEAFVSPLIDDDALERYREICEAARRDGEVLTGGSVVSSPELSAGRFVEPTVVRGIPHDHDLAREEHFLPFVTIHPVAGLDEAIRKSNDSSYGLCAGLFSEDPDEVDTWLDRIESGMCYVNRERSATTGALVQAQPFGGWKASGTTGKFAGGYWYLPQFLREQSRTVVGDVGRS